MADQRETASVTVMAAFLRGINVGGRTTVPMAELRAVLEEAGYADVRTYIQSGNVVLSTDDDDPGRVAGDLERVIATRFPLAPRVAVRTADQLRSILATNPFLARGEPPDHQHVVLTFDTDPPALALALADPGRFLPEEAIVQGSEVYLHLPDGVGRSKLAIELGKQQGPAGTMRSWRTMIRVGDLTA